ncbi:hypothetical protein OQA88_2328 [Cercophora sp. LCS_1]
MATFLQIITVFLTSVFSLSSPLPSPPPLSFSTLSTQEINNPLDITFFAGPPSTPPTLELLAARRALKRLKTLLGPSELKTLVTPDTITGNTAWHSILSSSSDSTPRVLSSVHFTAIPPDCHANFTSANFLGWFTTSAFTHVNKLWEGHPQHYFIAISQNDDGTLAAELVEPWGPILTHSKVPRLAPVTGQEGGGVKKPFMKERKGFVLQTVGEETLMDGSGEVVGDLHYSFRDLDGDNKGNVCGIEVVLDMWMPSATPEEVAVGIGEHLKIEYYNWVEWAYEEIRDGTYVPA